MRQLERERIRDNVSEETTTRDPGITRRHRGLISAGGIVDFFRTLTDWDRGSCLSIFYSFLRNRVKIESARGTRNLLDGPSHPGAERGSRKRTQYPKGYRVSN